VLRLQVGSDEQLELGEERRQVHALSLEGRGATEQEELIEPGHGPVRLLQDRLRVAPQILAGVGVMGDAFCKTADDAEGVLGLVDESRAQALEILEALHADPRCSPARRAVRANAAAPA
jgi:hypothetical protein